MSEHLLRSRSKFISAQDGEAFWQPRAVKGNCITIKARANILSEKNQRLLRLIADTQPQSIKELEQATGRKANNLLRTLRTMENYGFVKLVEGIQGKGRTPLIPKIIYGTADIEINFCGA